MQQLCLHGVYRRSPLSHRTSAFEWNLRLGPDMTPKTTGAPRAQNTNLMSRWSGEMEHFNQEGLDFMAPSTAQYFKVCETSFQHHTELKSRFILNALGYRNKLLDSYVQRNHIQVCNRREWACLLERQREGGRDVEAGRQMIFLGGGIILADFSFVSLFIQICFHPLADRTNMQQHTVESEHAATVSQICGEAFKRPNFFCIIIIISF